VLVSFLMHYSCLMSNNKGLLIYTSFVMPVIYLSFRRKFVAYLGNTECHVSPLANMFAMKHISYKHTLSLCYMTVLVYNKRA